MCKMASPRILARVGSGITVSPKTSLLMCSLTLSSLSWKNDSDWACFLLGKASAWMALWKVESGQGEARVKGAKSGCSRPTLAESLGNERKLLNFYVISPHPWPEKR